MAGRPRSQANPECATCRPVSIDMSFGDLLEKLNDAVMGSFLAKNDNWLLLTDLTWAQISADAVAKAPGIRRPTPVTLLPGVRVEFEMRQLMASAIAGYPCWMR